jgi:hypothetical protein
LANDHADWRAVRSGQQELRLSTVESARGTALKIDYDFKGGAGFVVARREMRLPIPLAYAVQFRARGSGPPNDLEIKLVDPGNWNVWRYVEKGLHPPARWRTITIPSDVIEFAWGPAGSGVISELGAVEFAIVAGSGGAGTLWIADFRILDRTTSEPPVVTSSSALPGCEAPQALTASGWRPQRHDPRPWIALDLVSQRTIGGLTIDWLPAAPASGFRIRGSNTGRLWKTLYSASRAAGSRTYIYLPGAKARYLRLELKESLVGAALKVQPFEFSRSIDTFWHSIAAAEPRGWHPRWLHREQSLWTTVGTANGSSCGLINEEGMVEADPGGFSLEPMLWLDGRLHTWADVTLQHRLQHGWAPVPEVVWQAEGWRLAIQGEALESGVRRVRYRFENTTAEPLNARLYVLLRPFQVTPPWQHFREFGGVYRIHDLAWKDGVVLVNGESLVQPLTPAAGFGAIAFDQGLAGAWLGNGTRPPATAAHDPFGFATGVLEFVLTAAPEGIAEAVVACSSAGNRGTAGGAAYDWAAKLPVGCWQGAGWAADAVATALTATGHILSARAGAAIQAGPRRYTRSWIRDGAVMAAALMRMSCVAEACAFIRWYLPFQREDGFVPCCVDREGPDWLVEHDSHGELLALIADYYRFTGDRALVEECWPAVEKTMAFLDGLLEPGGLLPISVSHEGYLAQPVHSYWDDFWGLRGIRDATALAQALGRDAQAGQWQRVGERLAGGLFASIEATRAQAALPFIPASREWADYDPTATANAIMLLGVPPQLDRKAVDSTFDRFMTDWRRTRSGEAPWSNYSPYQIRVITAMVRMGRRDDALELLKFYLSDRRPFGWNQWPEIAWRDPRAPGHVGDVPHCWIASEYVLALRSLFAYEDEAAPALVLGAGLAPEWLEGEGVQVRAAPTIWGRLSYRLRRIDARTVEFHLSAGVAADLVLCPPLPGPVAGATVDGAAHPAHDGRTITIKRLAADSTVLVQAAG